MRQSYDEFQRRDAEVLAISSENREAGAIFKASFELPFPLLVDADLRIIRAYGVFHENEAKGRLIARPATFVLDANGIIRYRYIGQNAGDRPSADTILAALSKAESSQEHHTTG